MGAREKFNIPHILKTPRNPKITIPDPAAAKEVVLAEKPLISEETDLLEPSLLSQLVCHIGSLASVYHKPPSSFIDPSRQPVRTAVQLQQQQSFNDIGGAGSPSQGQSPPPSSGGVSGTGQAGGGQGRDIIADLLSLDLSAPAGGVQPQAAAVGSGGGIEDLLGLGGGGGGGFTATTHQMPPPPSSGGGGLDFGIGRGGVALPPSLLSLQPGDNADQQLALPETILDATKGKGLQIDGWFSRRGGQIYMEMNLTNKALQPLSAFAIQFNSNSFGLIPAEALNVAPLAPQQSVSVSLPCRTNGPVQKMDPLTQLQVAVKDNVDVFYFAVNVPLHVYFDEDGQMDKRDFLQLWKEIPEQNEVQFNIAKPGHLSAGECCGLGWKGWIVKIL